ncbi:MAG TPA: RNA polymerase sigma factor [Bryobacteraceae bacterium]|nr:RNA polymerase sigma factor [Bryobacteraceae bacterium]
MLHETIARKKLFEEAALTDRFLDRPCEETFTDLFKIFSPRLVAFFRARNCSSAEDLAQEVMLAVYRKAGQLRNRSLFRAWMFKIARHALSRHYEKQTLEVDTIDLADVADTMAAATHPSPGTHAFEFHNWISVLDTREREALTLRYIEQWEYHEIASAQDIPIGTVQWRVHRAIKKLAPYLKRREDAQLMRRAA